MCARTLEINDRNNGEEWIYDVLDCVNKIKSDEFWLQEVYQYSEILQEKHRNNHNIKAKIRQQLQILRDRGIIEFLGDGCYRKIT